MTGSAGIHYMNLSQNLSIPQVLQSKNKPFAYLHPALTFPLQDVSLSDRNCCATPDRQRVILP